MDFDLNKAQKLLQQSARDFFARECKPERVRELMAGDTACDEGLWRAMADQGWTGLIIPEDFGGLGLSLVDLIAVSEEMGRACLPGPFLSTLWAAALIGRAGSEGQRKQYLEPIAAGDMKATVAMLEEDADWNPEAVGLSAEKDGKEYRLNGRKEFVTDAEVAVFGAPLDSGATYRPGARFGPQGIRRSTNLFGTYCYELGVDLREQLNIVDIGDDWIVRAVNHTPYDPVHARGRGTTMEELYQLYLPYRKAKRT